MTDQIQNAYLWNNFLMQGDDDWWSNDDDWWINDETTGNDLSGATMYGTAGGSHSAIPKTTTTKTTVYTTGAAAMQSATAAAHNAAAAVSAVNSGAIAPAPKKLFFDVIKKPYAIAGAAVLALGAGYLIFHHKKPAAKTTALTLHECH